MDEQSFKEGVSVGMALGSAISGTPFSGTWPDSARARDVELLQALAEQNEMDLKFGYNSVSLAKKVDS